VHTLRDCLVCGPGAALLGLLRAADAPWTVAAGASLALYGLLRLLAPLTGIESALDARRAARTVARLARLARREADARSRGPHRGP